MPLFTPDVEIRNDAGNAIPINGTVSSAQSGAWTTIPDRPSAKAGRTYVSANAGGFTSTTTIYTVTAGKTLYVKSIVLSGFNASTTTTGLLNIRDNATVRCPITIPTAGLGALASFVPIAVATISFEEPLEFSTNLNVEENTGTLTMSIAFTGYEE